MECLAEMKKRPKFIDAIEKFQLSGAYPVFFAILCTISGLGNKYVYLPVMSILAICVLFSVFFVRDNKVFLTPILMIFYSLGTDHPRAFFDSNGDVLAAFDTDGFIGVCILAVPIIIPFILRFILDGSLALSFKKKSFLIYGILALDAAILLGGAFSEYWTPRSLINGLIIIAGMNLFFIIIYSIILQHEADIIPYTAHILVIACLMISVQVIAVAVNAAINSNFIYFDTGMNRWMIQRLHYYYSWGIPTTIGAITAIGIPVSLYLAKNHRAPLFYYICAIAFFLISIIVNTRSAMIVGALFLIVGAIIISFSEKNKRTNLIFTASLSVAVIALIICTYHGWKSNGVLETRLVDLAKFFRFDMIKDRISLFSQGIDDFCSHPIFGVGFDKSVSHSDTVANNFFSNMYHCTIIQIGASAGVIGLIALIIHVKDIFILGIKKFSIDRLFILSVPIMILCMSMVDNFFFYLNFQIPYVAFLLLAQKHLEK